MSTRIDPIDAIIVGAGSAGCVLANRLTEDAKRSVLLLEAGPRDSHFWIHVPLGYGKLFTKSEVNWGYESEPEPALNARRIFTPRGKVLGGSSSINGLVYIRGQREDFDGWAIPGWGFDELLPYFRKSEDQSRGADAWHGAGGPLSVSDLPRHELCDAFIAAAQAIGIPRNDDFNGASQEGAGAAPPMATCARRGAGPTCASKSKRWSQGCFPKAANVGEDLQDHFYARTFWRCCRDITLNDDMASWLRQARIGLQYFLFRQGPLTVAAGHAAAFVRTKPQLRQPDVQIYFINFSAARRGGFLHPHSGFTTAVSQLQVESRGSVRIKSADPAAPPAIRYNYLASENDRRVMVDGLKIARRIVNTAPMRDYVVEEFMPGAKVQSDEDWLAYCREMGETVFHPTSTCRMGTVVDEKLRVKGVEGLRVVDASVMPAVPSGNINAAVIAVAEKAGDLISRR